MEKRLNEPLWAQAYRPSTIKDVIVPKRIASLFTNYAETYTVPSLLLYDPKGGTGKTTMAFALCNDLNIEPYYLNGSLATSIENIRYAVQQYATEYSLDGRRKVVIIDEADRLSLQALDAIKALMEEVSQTCSFIFTCNNKARFETPLLSRFTVIDFIYTEQEKKEVMTAICKRCIDILNNENVEHDVKVIAEVIKQHSPNNRMIINKLQEYYHTYGKIDTGILACVKGISIESVLPHLKAKKFKDLNQWSLDYAELLQDNVYFTLYKLLESDLTGENIAHLILILDKYQEKHNKVPSKYIHIAAMLIEIMTECEFKR